MLEFIFGARQASIPGPLLLFNIFFVDLFFIIDNTDVTRYVDDNATYLSADKKDGVISLKKKPQKFYQKIKDNLMKINADKCHLLVSTNSTVKIKIRNFDITNGKNEKLTRVTFDHKLSFDYHISELRKKPWRKINALSGVASYIDIS